MKTPIVTLKVTPQELQIIEAALACYANTIRVKLNLEREHALRIPNGETDKAARTALQLKRQISLKSD